MAGIKQRVLGALRDAGLLMPADRLRYRWMARRARAHRAAFSTTHPGVALPPDDVAYDAYGMLDWNFYWGFGDLAARFFAERIVAHARSGRVLEWGCGPARIIRHLPQKLGPDWDVHGCDVNQRTIEWCAASLPGITFTAHEANPPLPFPSQSFDCIYAVSVFTHLPDAAHAAWARELRRIIKPGGLLMCTMNGDAARPLLLPREARCYDRDELVVRGGVSNGTRCYLAFHPPRYVRHELLREFEIREQVPAPNLLGARQDVWIATSLPL